MRAMRYLKHDLVEKLGEPAEENVRPNLRDASRPMDVLRWNCGCGAAKSEDEQMWEWDPGECVLHAAGPPAT